ncbi:MAG: basic amino acid ABC transporter substrate-binding protein [Spirochaetes bacterium]|nr:MAG: basic amino acid ABC transporter substrate-binding protein [Spirochaetota bacterium]
MVKKIFLIVVSVFVIAGVLFAGGTKKEEKGAKKKIVVATDATWPPMEYIDEQTKEIIGFDIDLMKEIAKAAGFEVEFKNTAWDGIFAGLAAGKYDAVMSSVTITEERKKEMDFSKPYINAGQVLIVRQETQGVETLRDMVGKKVGAQIGTTGAFEVEKVEGVELKTYDEIGLAFEDLVNGRIDGVVADTPVAANFALQNPTYKGKLKIVGEPFTEEYYGIAVQKGNKELLDMINKGLDEVLGTPTYDALVKKWLR